MAPLDSFPPRTSGTSERCPTRNDVSLESVQSGILVLGIMSPRNSRTQRKIATPSKGEKVKIIRKENESFRIGPSYIYTSEVCYEIEVEINNLKEKIKVSVIEANIPLLLGLEYKVKWAMVIDLGKQEIHIRKSGDRFKK